jgi:hypothetical protein
LFPAFTNRAWTGWSFLVLGIAATLGATALLAYRVLALQRWANTQGRVVESKVFGPNDEGSYYAKVTVRWEVNSEGFSKGFATWGNGGQAAAEKIVARYPQGSAAPILYNPAKPSRAFLDAKPGVGFFLAPVAAVFLSLAAAVLGYLIKP